MNKLNNIGVRRISVHTLIDGQNTDCIMVVHRSDHITSSVYKLASAPGPYINLILMMSEAARSRVNKHKIGDREVIEVVSEYEDYDE